MSQDTQTNDEQSISRLKHDSPCFDDLYRSYRNTLSQYLLRQTKDREIAADLTADIFLTALASWNSYRPAEGSAPAWLWGITQNKLADWRESERTDREVILALGTLALIDGEASSSDSDYYFETPGTTALSNLTVNEQIALLERVVRGSDYRELATRYHCSEGAMRQRVNRALSKLRRRFCVR